MIRLICECLDAPGCVWIRSHIPPECRYSNLVIAVFGSVRTLIVETFGNRVSYCWTRVSYICPVFGHFIDAELRKTPIMQLYAAYVTYGIAHAIP